MDKAKKKRIKKIITWVAMAAVVAVLTAMPLLARQEAESEGPKASILSAEVTKGTVTTALHGGGTVSAGTVEEIKLPSGVKIKEFLVKNGQFVTEGTPVATVDKVSVMTAITEVSDTMDYLRQELEDARDEKISSTIKATAGGRVKKIFAEKGESVQEVMLRDGALAILSLDGLMAVKLERQLPLTTGESVTVTIDEEEVTGRVESNLDGVVVITVEDEGYEIGQTVTVTNADGDRLGQSELYIHNAWKATAYTGTIEAVNAKEEKVLSSGATLFTLTDRDYEGELRHRSAQHREYEALLQKLFQMYESGVLTAPCDGEVEGVDEDSAYLLSSIPEGWVLAPLTNPVTGGEEKRYTVLLLGNSECDGTENCKLSKQEHAEDAECLSLCLYCKHNPHDPNCLGLCTGNPVCPNANDARYHFANCLSLCTGKAGCQAPQARHTTACPERCTNNANCISSRPMEEHGIGCIVHCVRDTDGSDGYQCKDTNAHYGNCIGNCTGGKLCSAVNHKQDCYYYGVTYSARVALVVRSVSGTIEYKYDKSAQPVPVTRAANGSWVLAQVPGTQTMNDTGFISSGTACSPGDTILILSGRNTNGDPVEIANPVHVYAKGSSSGGFGNFGGMSGFGGMGGMNISGMIGGFSGYGNYSAAEAEEEDLFDLEGDTLLTVTPHHIAKLSISIDEHDIAKVSLGMKATVKIEALRGETFEAEVTGIALSGSNNGGSSKFAVELQLPMSQDMLPGMSASAVIPLEEKTGILTIPAAALHQQGAKTMVFTALDEKTGEPAGPVEVTTGISDGETVEILSGLEEGQTVYYAYYDTVELDTSAQADKYTLR